MGRSRGRITAASVVFPPCLSAPSDSAGRARRVPKTGGDGSGSIDLKQYPFGAVAPIFSRPKPA